MTKAKISLVLRLLALGSTAAAIAIMVTSHETAKVLNLSFEAKYHDTPAFVYFVVAEAIAGGYSLVSLLLSCKTLVGRFVMMMDVVIAMLLSSSISAAVTIGQVGKNGNGHAGWLPICGQVPSSATRSPALSSQASSQRRFTSSSSYAPSTLFSPSNPRLL